MEKTQEDHCKDFEGRPDLLEMMSNIDKPSTTTEEEENALDNQLLGAIYTTDNEPLEYSINPTCQEILKSDLKASDKITELVNIYLKDYPDFTPLAEEFMHPSCQRNAAVL